MGAIPESATTAKTGLRRRGTTERTWPWVLLFLGPNALLFLLFMVFPVAYGLYISFFDWKIVEPPHWVGLQNYVKFFQDPLSAKLLVNTLYFMVGTVVPLMAISLACAVLLNAVTRLVGFWRGMYFLPLVTSLVAAASVWQWLYAKDFGLLNYFLSVLHIPKVDWLFSTRWAMPALIMMTIWKQLPFNTILFLAGLQEVPGYLYEAAEVDGATGWHKFRHITVPLLTPTTFFVFVITLIGLLFGSFDTIAIMTQGGPLSATDVFIYNIYQNAFQYFRLGYASAQAYILFMAVFLFTMFQWWFQKRWVHY
jgi:multiple sugar transport system permease protein